MRARRRRLVIHGGLVALIAGMITPLTLDWEQPPSLALIPITRPNQGGANSVVFRLTSDDPRPLILSGVGYLEIPLGPQSHSGRWRFWAQSSIGLLSKTNLAPTTFMRQVDFTIPTPTNKIWRLRVHLMRIRPYSPWKERIENEWQCLKSRNFSAMRGAWSVPSVVAYPYDVYSPYFTNGAAWSGIVTLAVCKPLRG